MGAEARRYSWSAFAPGHELSVRHGVWSRRRVDPLVQELVAGLATDRPDLLGYPETLVAWARAEARCILFAEYLADEAVDSERALKVARYIVSFERLAVDLRVRLGLDPQSEATLARERAQAAREIVDLDGLRARGRAVLEAREAKR
jgi:hypothetical protein